MKVFKLLVSVGLFALGTPCLMRKDTWFWFGFIMWGMGAVSFMWIVFGDMWRVRAEYCEKL